MLFSHLSTMAVATAFIWANFPQVTATNQALVDCELKCSQRWSFPAPASPSSTSSYIKAKPTSTYTPTETRVIDHAPTPITTSKVADSFQVEPSSSSKKHVAAVTSSSSSPSSPSTTSIRTVPISTTTLKTTPTSTPDDNPKSSSSSPGIDGYLAPHNAARAAHGASPLSWSDELAAAAQRWANNCVFEHSGGSLGPYGENLAAGSGDYSAESGVAAWVNEAAQYNSANPVPSHFTQVVWKGTTQVGCAVASCNLANFDPQFWPVKFHVCEYSSPGNVIGQFAANVQA